MKSTEMIEREADARRYAWIKANSAIGGACVRWPKGVWTIDSEDATLDDLIDLAMMAGKESRA
jgi:hypothetical protein